MVARLEDWRWSSLGAGAVRQAHDCAGVDGKRVQLAQWPVVRPVGWVERVNAMVAKEELERPRRASGAAGHSPDDGWERRTTRRLGFESTLHDPWRPKKPPPAARETDSRK